MFKSGLLVPKMIQLLQNSPFAIRHQITVLIRDFCTNYNNVTFMLDHGVVTALCRFLTITINKRFVTKMILDVLEALESISRELFTGDHGRLGLVKEEILRCN